MKYITRKGERQPAVESFADAVQIVRDRLAQVYSADKFTVHEVGLEGEADVQLLVYPAGLEHGFPMLKVQLWQAGQYVTIVSNKLTVHTGMIETDDGQLFCDVRRQITGPAPMRYSPATGRWY